MKPMKHPADPETCQRAARYSIRICEEMSKRSTLLSREEAPETVQVAVFDREEILPYLGECLGRGGFNSVYELTKIKLQSETDERSLQGIFRKNVAASNEKLAVKFLSDEVMKNPEEFCNGAADLLMEAKYLQALSGTQNSHPALIQLHGVCRAGPNGFARPERAGFFLVIDRLYDTLDRRIDIWRELESRKYSGGNKNSTREIQALFIQRLMVAQDIASALRHLHKLQVIFRDLKPDNVGFDFEGRVKLFDFGLAKELDPRQENDDGLYCMSGGTGSRRFMAPEVALSEPYTLSADIYSFSILFWEILTYEKAFGRIPSEEHREKVVKKGERPRIHRHWSKSLTRLLESSWSRNQAARPKARELYKSLREEIHRTYENEFVKKRPDSQSDSASGRR